MADAVNRIVPPSVSRERASGLTRERKRRNPNEKQHAQAIVAPATPDAKADEQEVLTESERDKTKGKNLDINA
jgi:hypothetical protein